MAYEIVTIGSATVDQFAETDSELIQIETPTMKEKLIAFPLGSKILIKELTLSVGGGGTNSAVCFSRLGLNTAFMGKIGQDGNGDFILQQLQKEGVDFIGAREGVSGVSVILNSFADDRTILAFKGANNQLGVTDIPPLDTRWVYLSSMLETSFDSVMTLLQQHSFRLAFNPSNYQAEMGYAALSELINKVDILVMNLEEACKFLGLVYTQKPDPDTVLTKLAELPPSIVVITDGKNGVYASDGDYAYHAHPVTKLAVKETTGAGDAFSASFTAACIREYDIETAIHLAMTNAESVLQHRGAKEKLLSMEEVLSIADQQRRVITKKAF